MGHSRGLSPLSSFLLLSSCFLPLIYAADKPRKSARAYSSPSSSSNSLYGSSSSSGGNGYNDNFDSAFDSMDLNNNGKSQKIRISLPNPPRPPRPPRPMKGPNMGSFENDPNRMPNMPRPPSPPAGFGPMDIEFNFPSYEPSVDDSFFDSDSGFGNSGYSSGFGSSSSSNNNGGSYSNGNNGNSNNGGGSSYGTRTQYGGTYYTSNNSSTTPRSSTLSSTSYATYSTAAGGGGAGGAGVVGSTTVPPSSLQLCAPSTDPTITNGRCVQTAALPSLCKSPAAAAPSTGCPAGERCCFNRANTPPPTTTANPPSTATATTPAASSTTPRVVADGTICSPLTNPTVSNGRCTTTNVVPTQCVGQQLAKSNQCSTSQFCCFRAPQAAGAALPTGNRLTVEVSLPSESAASSTGSCRPASNPLARGHCIGLQNLPSACRGHQASKSADCVPQEWCCIDEEASGDRVSVGVVADIQPALTATADGSCRPKTNPSANGQCISSDLVAAQCASHQAAKSDDCNAQSWCCILGTTSGGATSVGTTQVPPASLTQASTGGSCRPKTNPSANGQCILADNIASQCASRQASKSDDCNAQSWCCILATTSGGATSAGTSQAPATTPASTTQASNGGSTTQSSGGTSGKTCRPATNPSASGQCFATASLSSQCSGRSASKSSDCSSDQWCCINLSGSGGSGGSASVPAGTACTPRSNLAARGTCVATSGLSNDCNDGRPAAKSDNCGSDQWCCFTAPAASTNKEANVEVKVTLSGNTDGNNMVVSPSISQATQCTPKDNPNVKNGKCLTMRELSQQCVDQKTSASGDCAFGRFCCYSDNEVAGGGGGGGGNQAAVALPASAPSVSVQINKESSSDGGNNGPSVVISTASASSDSSSSGNKEGSSSVVISTSSSSSSSAKTCSPNSNQAIKNGACMTIRELRISCIEHKASPSTECDLGSWCCFSDDNAVVVLPPPANTQVKIEVAATPPVENAVAPAAGDASQCVPNSKPDISNGACLATKDLRTRCKNQRVSKSPQCKLGQWCCFNDSGAPVQLSLNEFSRNINTL